MLTHRPPKGEDGAVVEWKHIHGQYDADLKLEVTLGKTYLKIDEEVAEDVAECEHEKFIRGIASTDPENLKMIAGLKTLDDGMKAPLDPPKLNGTSQPIKATSYAYNTVPVSQSMMNIDHNDNISFSTKMAEAIRKVNDEPRPGPSGVGKSP
jgi:hypothetical protein